MNLAVNISANAASRLWLALLQLLMTPIIVSLLGPDSYGLVGFSTTITLFLSFFDQCISPLLARELSTATEAKDKEQYNRDLLRTLEIISCLTGLVIGVTIMLLAPWIAGYGLASGGLSEETRIGAVRLIGLFVICQWPSMLYASGFVGLQRQDLLVAVRIVSGTLASVGGALLLWLAGASITLYLSWLAGIACLASLILGWLLWQRLPGAPARFDGAALKRLWRFALGNLLIGISAALLSQAPGLIVAATCSLPQLAAYTLGMTLAQQVATLLTQPVSSTLTPHFTRMMGRNDSEGLAREYHRWTQMIVFLALPPVAMLFFFAQPLIQLWLGADSPLAGPVAELLPLAALGTLFNILITPAYTLQIAAGWTRLSIQTNAVAVPLILALVLLLTPIHGPVGAVISWLVINLGYYLFYIPLMHRKLLTDQLWRWWLLDTLLPCVLVFAVYAMLNAWLPQAQGLAMSLSRILLIASAAALAVLAVLPLVRDDLIKLARRLLKRP